MDNHLVRRNSKIVEMRKKTTLREVAEKFNLTISAVWFVCNPKKYNFCKKHKLRYFQFCKLCEKKKYDIIYNSMFEDDLVKKGKTFIKEDRLGKKIIQKRALVRVLRDEFGWSFVKIGKLLKRHHSSIINLYHNG